MSDCAQRAFAAGLRWAGLPAEVGDLPDTVLIAELARELGLTVTEKAVYDASPVLVVYRDGKTATCDDYHAVFASDFAPFVRWDVVLVVTGWERLNANVAQACGYEIPIPFGQSNYGRVICSSTKDHNGPHVG